MWHQAGSTSVSALTSPHQRARALLRYQPMLSNSPRFAPCVNAAHSDSVNRSTGPSGSLLSRSATPPSGSAATSTQLLLLNDRLDLTHSMCSILSSETCTERLAGSRHRALAH